MGEYTFYCPIKRTRTRGDIVNCRKCGAVIERGWKCCPVCGTKLKRRNGTILAVLVALYVLYRLIILSTGDTTKGQFVTFENYEKITTDMTYEDVYDLFGERHSLKFTANMDEYAVDSYLWYAEDGRSNCTIAFDENGYVSSKSSFGLEDGHIQAVLMLD